MFNPCHAVFHPVATTVRRPFHYVAHRVIGRALRRTGSHAAPLHAAHPVPAACLRVPGALPAGPGLAASADTLGGIAGLGAAALLFAGLAVAGLGLDPGSSGGTGAGGPTAVAAGPASFGSTTGDASGPVFDAGIELLASPTALNTGLPAGWFSGSDKLAVAGPSSARTPPLSWTTAPDNVLDTSQPPTAVPEPASLALLAAGSVAVLFFRAVPSRRRGSPRRKRLPNEQIPVSGHSRDRISSTVRVWVA